MTPPEVGGCPEGFSISSPRLCQPGLSHSTEMVATQNGGILLFAQKRGAKSTSLEVHERFDGAVVAVYQRCAKAVPPLPASCGPEVVPPCYLQQKGPLQPSEVTFRGQHLPLG